MHTIRQTSGLAGFPKRDESIYDAFGAGHSSTSISAGLGEDKFSFLFCPFLSYVSVIVNFRRNYRRYSNKNFGITML